MLGDETSLMVEDPWKGRVRLQRGEFSVEGNGIVISQIGVLELEDAEATVALDRGRLEVACVRGIVKLVHSGGVEELAPGDTAIAGVAAVDVHRR